MKWIIDGKIDLLAICETEDWHLASAVDALKDLGLSVEDAYDFVNFAFEWRSQNADAHPESYLNEAQINRLEARYPRPGRPVAMGCRNYTVSLDDWTVERLRKLSDGNLSGGIRAAARKIEKDKNG